MGLFSSDYITTVGTNTARVIEDHSLPDSLKHGAIKGLLDEGDQFVANILEEFTQSLGLKTERVYNYGASKYDFGLPSSNTLVSNSGSAQVKAQIETTLGQGVSLDYYKFGPLNNIHLGWTKLVADHGYNVKTGILGVLSTAKGKPVMLTNMVPVVTEASLMELNNGSLDQWGDKPAAHQKSFGNEADALAREELRSINNLVKAKPFELDEMAPNDYLRVEYTWEESYTAVVEGINVPRTRMEVGSFTIQMVGYDINADWHQAKYTLPNGEMGYWLYMGGAGTYPLIDSVHDTAHDDAGSYYPWLYFRFNKQSGNADKAGNWYKQSSRMADYIGVDYDAVCDAIHENPDIDKVEQAMLMMGVPAVTENQMEMRYLFDFFNQLLETSGGKLQENKSIQYGGGSKYQKLVYSLDSSLMDSAIVIQDSRFKLSLGFRQISSQIIQGTIGNGKVGTCASGWLNEAITETGTKTAEQGGGPVSWSTQVKTHWYRKQITTTQYEEIRVNNLKMKYHIFEGYAAVADENDDILLIPLDRSITSHYGLPKREELYARSLHYIFNSKQVTEVKWYQQEWFRFVLIVAAIVMTIVTYGQTWQAVAAAVAAGTITIAAVIWMIAVAIFKYLVVQALVKLFVKAVGLKFALIIAIIAAAAGAWQAIEAGGLAGAPWASTLLQLSTNLTSAINVDITSGFEALGKEAQDFQLFMKEERKRLEEGQKLLENNSWLIPTVIFGEKPDEFYNRTVHSGNIGVLGLDAISSFVDVRLQLPKLNDTV